MRVERSALIAAAIAHVLAWAMFLWIVIGQCVDQCAFFLVGNGLWFLTAMFIPVVLTGLALITLLTWTVSRLGAKFVLGILAVLLLAFCGMGYLSYGWAYLPPALALTTAAIIFGVRSGDGKQKMQHEDLA